MRRKTIGRAWLLTAWLVLAPGGVWAQSDSTGYAPPEPNLPLPLYSTHPEEGGLFVAGSYVMYRQTNPIRDQVVAVRGFQITDPTFGAPVGTFLGDRSEALNTHQVSGPSGFQPGFTTSIGWKFVDGSALTFTYLWLSTAQYRAVATLVPRDLNFRDDQSNTFLFSSVFNFPNDYAGPPFKIAANNSGPGNPGTPVPFAAYGIWNGASIMTLKFEQRYNEYDLSYRVPVYDTECYRLSGLVGPRIDWIWDRFQWRTTSLDPSGITQPNDVAIYNNIVSNRMYGVSAGCRQEWYVGHGFACDLDLRGSIFYDSAKEEAKYELGTKFAGPENKRALREVHFVPEVQATVRVTWFPTEGVQLFVGYDIMAFFNTVASPRPIDFNYSALDPQYESTFRLFDGFQAGVALIF